MSKYREAISKYRMVLAAGVFVVAIFCMASGAIVFHGRTMLNLDRGHLNMTNHEVSAGRGDAADRQQDVTIASAGTPVALESGLTTVSPDRQQDVTIASAGAPIALESGLTTVSPDRQQDVTIASAGVPISLESGLTTVSLKASRSGESLKQSLSSFSPNRNLYLIIGDLSAAQQPGVAYHLFLDLPAGVKPELNNAYYVGTVNFYNAVRLEGADPDSKDQRVFSFDITRIVRNLISKGRLNSETTVTFKPGGVPVDGAQARIGRLHLIAE